MPDPSGRWRNQNGSLLELSMADDGSLAGSFTSARGRAAQGTPYALTGQVLGELVSFIVAFRAESGDLAAMTTFTARWHEDAHGEHLHALWVLAREYEDPARTRRTQVWNTFITNHDIFDRIS